MPSRSEIPRGEVLPGQAIGRLAGPGMMKGVSPVSLKQQAEAEIQSFLDSNLNSPAGAMSCLYCLTFFKESASPETMISLSSH